MVSDSVSKDMSLSEYKDSLLKEGFNEVHSHQIEVDLSNVLYNEVVCGPDDIFYKNVSIWVNLDKGYIIEVTEPLFDYMQYSVNMYCELETLKCFNRISDVNKWFKNNLGCNAYRVLLGLEDFTHTCHLQRDVKSALPEYLWNRGRAGFSVDGVNLLKTNNVWTNFNKHPLYLVLKDNLVDPEVKNMFGISD